MRRIRPWSALAVALVVAGCARDTPPPIVERGSPERIIAPAPSVTEIVFALGLGEQVVGVGDYARWPPEVDTKARIGGLFDPRFEEIVALEPDLAILLPSEEALASRMGELGVEVLTVPSETLADVETAIGSISARTGREGEAEALLASFRAELEPQPFAGAPRVALTVTRQVGVLTEILVPGGDTFYDELLERLGVINVFGDSALLYPQVGPEQWLDRQPVAIVELQPKPLSEHQSNSLIGDWHALPELNAVRSDCVTVVDGSHTLLPGPRLPQLYREIRAALVECLGEEAAG